MSICISNINRLNREQRARVLHLLCEGNSIRDITRLTGISKTTVTKLVVDAGKATAWYQDRVFRTRQGRLHGPDTLLSSARPTVALGGRVR
jgi:transposase